MDVSEGLPLYGEVNPTLQLSFSLVSVSRHVFFNYFNSQKNGWNFKSVIETQNRENSPQEITKSTVGYIKQAKIQDRLKYALPVLLEPELSFG